MKKIILCAGICLAVLAGCSWNKNNSQPAPSASPSPSPSALPTIDPAITEASDIVGETTAFGTPIVSVQMKDGKISLVSIDEITEDTTKKALGDQYKLGEQAIAGWSEQIKALEDYIVAHGLDAVDVDEEGKAANEDLRTQCTITIQNYLQTVEKAVSQAEHPEPVQK